MKNNPLLRTVAAITIPLMFVFGFYVLFHGKVSPGGGFQGGAICATAYMLQAMVFGVDSAAKFCSETALKTIACIGALIYAGIGFAGVFLNAEFLNYYALTENEKLGQFIGVMGIEIGVQFTVFAGLSLIYLKLAKT